MPSRQMVSIHIKKLHPDAVIPRYAHLDDSGFDLVCCEDTVIPPKGVALVPIGIAMEIPNGYEMQIRPRSSIAAKKEALIPNSPGTVDAGYRGEIKVLIRSLLDQPMHVGKGVAIAQGVICEVPLAVFTEVKNLRESQRGEGGFGSTGETR